MRRRPSSQHADVPSANLVVHESWQIGRTLTEKITNRDIDEIYDAGPSSGALRGNSWGRPAADLCSSGYTRRSGIGRSRLGSRICCVCLLLIKGSRVVAYKPETPYDQALALERSLIYA